MKKIVVILSLACCQNLSAQKIRGVYHGEIITHNNVFSITSKGTVAIGSVYLNPYNKLSFLGNFTDGLLQGDIIDPNGDNKYLIGGLVNDSLFIKIISYLDTSQVRFSWLARVSFNPKHDPTKLFDREATEYDPKLFGSWLLKMTLDQNGVENTKEIIRNENIEYSYWEGGSSTFSSNSLKRMNVSKYMPQRSWETKGNKLITTTIFPPLPVPSKPLPFALPTPPTGPVKSISTYEIRNDTLIIFDKKGDRSVYIKKP